MAVFVYDLFSFTYRLYMRNVRIEMITTCFTIPTIVY